MTDKHPQEQGVNSDFEADAAPVSLTIKKGEDIKISLPPE
jgi:hypothetical protein